MTLETDLRRHLEASREDMHRFAQDLIAIPTRNPPGERLHECAERIALELDRLHLQPILDEIPGDGPGEPGLWVRGATAASGPALYFHGHYDVVPASAPGQFDAIARDGRLFGRGSADMKSGVALMVYAAEAVAACISPDGGRIALSLVPDEETGGQRGSGFLQQGGLLGIDGVGMLTAEPTGGVVWNANRGAVSMRITIHGRSAHVGLSHTGKNAFTAMVKLAAALSEVGDEISSRRTAQAVHSPEADRSILLLGGEFGGGQSFNVVPDRATFTIDRRTNPEEDLHSEQDRIEEIVDGFRKNGMEIEAETFQYGDAASSSPDSSLAQDLSEAVREVTGVQPSFEMCPGLLETRFYAALNQPAYAFGPGGLDVAHQAGEFVELKSVDDTALIYAITAARHLSRVMRP